MVPAWREKTFVLDSLGRHDFATVHLKQVRDIGPYKYCAKIVSRTGNAMTVPVVGAVILAAFKQHSVHDMFGLRSFCISCKMA